MSKPLSLDVYVTPMRPIAGTPAQGLGDEPMWSPMSSTLIHGERDAILVDTLVTFDQVNALADWVDGLGLLERFPEAKALARPAPLQRAQVEATDPNQQKYWQTLFAGEIPKRATVPEPMMETHVDLDGQRIEAIDIGQGDTEHSIGKAVDGFLGQVDH